MNYLSNAFSLQMLENFSASVVTTPVKPEDIPEDFISVIGHPDTAQVVSSIIGKEVPVNRISIKLSAGDTLYVAQFNGGRLPEGATTLPKDMTLSFIKIEVQYSINPDSDTMAVVKKIFKSCGNLDRYNQIVSGKDSQCATEWTPRDILTYARLVDTFAPLPDDFGTHTISDKPIHFNLNDEEDATRPTNLFE